jgi:hypothetical protein
VKYERGFCSGKMQVPDLERREMLILEVEKNAPALSWNERQEFTNNRSSTPTWDSDYHHVHDASALLKTEQLLKTSMERPLG